ncbi:MAG: complex I NDUFA9 subunit family protein, partial [Geminicoccaceae bacterium]
MAALITVFGGSGFLGREIVRQLAAKGCHVRVAVRQPDRVTFPKLSDAPGRVTTLAADIGNDISVSQALSGASAVVNAVSLYAERGDATFVAVHVKGAQRLARQAAKAGLERLVHLSGVGVDARSSSSYIRARAGGEKVVLDAFPLATILRPSVMFGPGDTTFTALASLIRRSPILPLFGRGGTRLQPVYVGDVAAAAVMAL